jgi:hypothetical protein
MMNETTLKIQKKKTVTYERGAIRTLSIPHRPMKPERRRVATTLSD